MTVIANYFQHSTILPCLFSVLEVYELCSIFFCIPPTGAVGYTLANSIQDSTLVVLDCTGSEDSILNCDYKLDASSCSTDDENAAVMCSEAQSELVILCELEHACRRNAVLSFSMHKNPA